MDTFKQILQGWLFSLIAPFIVSILVGLGSAIFIGPWRGEDSFGARVEMGLSMYLGWSFLGLHVTAIMVAILGAPLFLLVKKLGFLHSWFFFLIGCGLGGLIFFKEVWWFSVLFALYGGVAAWLFWYGAVKRHRTVRPTSHALKTDSNDASPDDWSGA